ncbi:MaoC family dehydratase [Pelagerythrobacter marensis]|uniref:MaoC family dehydratase n=1 Tax=Pelagerythrobacter marensis TaxID=543877 RepID=A0ABZ2D5T7_9SPHN
MSGPRIFARPADLLGSEGVQLGPTEWLAIEQSRVDGFAEVTGDHQWIHVDVERAKDGPFGGTIAHGYLTLALVNRFLPDLVEVRGFAHAVNIGADRLRFLAPVPVGSRIRAAGEIVKVEDISGAIQSTVRVTIEIEGGDKPACTIDTISRYYPENGGAE